MTDITHAKQVLRDAGYVVIPRERHAVLTVIHSVDWRHMESIKASDDSFASFSRYRDGSMARQIGAAMLEKGAIVKTEYADTWRHATKFEAGVILPK